MHVTLNYYPCIPHYTGTIILILGVNSTRGFIKNPLLSSMSIDFFRMMKDFHIECRGDGTNKWININCPFCNPKDLHFNGGLNKLNPRFNCWRCGKHSWYDALCATLNMNIVDLKNTLKNYEYISSIKEEKQVGRAEHLDLPGYKLDENECNYLKGRGFDIDYLQSKFHLRGGGQVGNWSYRILIPVYYNNVLVSWTGRSILDKETLKELNIPRYKNLSIEQSVINPKEIFFNLDNSTKDTVILVEGPMDVMKMGDDTICSLGTSLTREQELLLSKRYKKIFVAFDNEIQAQKKGLLLANNLCSVGMEVELVNICKDFNKNDPGELTYQEVQSIKSELGL